MADNHVALHCFDLIVAQHVRQFVNIFVQLVILTIFSLKKPPEVCIERAVAIFVALFVALDWVDVEVLDSVQGQLQDVHTILDGVWSSLRPDVVAFEILLL